MFCRLSVVSQRHMVTDTLTEKSGSDKYVSWIVNITLDCIGHLINVSYVHAVRLFYWCETPPSDDFLTALWSHRSF